MTHFTDRSRFEDGRKCDRKRFFGYHFTDGQSDHRGVRRIGSKEELLFGSAVHSFVEDCFRCQRRTNGHFNQLLDLVADQRTPDGLEVADEYVALFEGLTSTFADYNLPSLLNEYEFVDAEQESVMGIGATKWMSRRDVTLRRKDDGLWFVLEAKTTSYMDLLLKQAPTNFQLLMEIESMRRDYNLKEEEVGGALLLAFNKGQRKRATAGEQAQGKDGYRRLSPFTYLFQKEYVNGTVKQGVEWKSGWDRLPSWTVPGWPATLKESFEAERRAQVQVFPSISFDAERLSSKLLQVETIESGYAQGDSWLKYDNHPTRTRGDVIDMFWPQSDNNCHNDGGFGKPCPFLQLCASPRMAADPVGSGEYEWRTPFNHPIEGEQI